MTVLNASTLGSLDPQVAVPGYDRRAVAPAIVHIGVGGFHRAHQAMYLDRLMNRGDALDWGVCGVGLLPGDRRMRDALDLQDGLYTLVVKHPDGRLEARVIGSLVAYLFAPDDPEAVIVQMAAPITRIVSLTITEGGYHQHPVTGEFRADDPAVQADLAPGAAPATVFGLVTEALARRRERGLPPFTVMSCDNVPGNGDVARRSFVAFARLRDQALGDWVEREVRFPSSMVDRITPATTEDDRELVAAAFGIEDEWPVVCEPFAQWVVEDDFGQGRPPWEAAGVQVVEDVGPYELMKLRLLNGGHQALCYLARLAGYRLAHEAAQDPLFAQFLAEYLDQEVTPTLADVPGVDLAAYKRTLLERFASPAIRDPLARLCADGSDRVPRWLAPVARSRLAAGGDVGRCALVIAAWARHAEGVDDQGEPFEVVDRLRDRLRTAAAAQSADPTAFLAQRDLFGDLVDDRRFVAAYSAALGLLRERGARAAVEALVGPVSAGARAAGGPAAP
ncbi:mannitol dehydrogenase family protein [Cellulomonas timonensis]|uniref:mannitol dehydrogenase family protein n=1 Tax=Cellulomonas timonensis TaxID=1689271 RepID=UPI00082E4240|nr:mannitol dehydrogenase family protein [Cellulomonas timonensis]